MILIEKTKVIGLDHAIRGMRNPMNSWNKSDSGYFCGNYKCDKMECCNIPHYIVGKKDHELMMKLVKGGPVHAKFRRMIIVYVDITAPLYWWKEFDTYKIGTVANSCSTMHKIHAKEFTIDDFSHETLTDKSFELLLKIIDILNDNRDAFNTWNEDYMHSKKRYWYNMIQLLPSSYNQKRTVMLNYEVLTNIYQYRKDHKLDEWKEFCKWIERLPWSEIITCNASENDIYM